MMNHLALLETPPSTLLVREDFTFALRRKRVNNNYSEEAAAGLHHSAVAMLLLFDEFGFKLPS